MSAGLPPLPVTIEKEHNNNAVTYTQNRRAMLQHTLHRMAVISLINMYVSQMELLFEITKWHAQTASDVTTPTSKYLVYMLDEH
jgi:hypothetical protein